MLSQKWPRDSRYISRSWAVAEIWPFEIRRHLEFVRIENSAIRSAVPENPTLEPNMKWIGSPVAEIWSFAYMGVIWNPHFGRKGRSQGVSDDTTRKSDGSIGNYHRYSSSIGLRSEWFSEWPVRHIVWAVCSMSSFIQKCAARASRVNLKLVKMDPVQR